jgi:hypothetical protein
MRHIALAKHYAFRAAWSVLPPAARRVATAFRLAHHKPRIIN